MGENVTYTFNADADPLLDALGRIDSRIAASGQSLERLGRSGGSAFDALAGGSDRAARAQQRAAERAGATTLAAFAPIGRAWDVMVSGILMGTQTWEQAVHRAIANMLIAEIEADAKWLGSRMLVNALGLASDTRTAQGGMVAWLLADQTKTEATQAGAAARAAAETAGQSGGLAQIAGNALKAISAFAGETFGGIFAFLAPTMGPAAAGPAAAGEAAVMAQATFASFDGGAWRLPSDMLALVHAGETIVPAGPAQALRSFFESGAAERRAGGSAGGEVHVHLNVAAMDSRDVKRFFADNRDHLASALRGAWRDAQASLR